jgi:hypothetical protein
MKTNQLIIGGAVLAVGLYLYSRSNKTSTTTAIEKEESSTSEEKPMAGTSTEEKPIMTNPAQGKPTKVLKNQTSTTKETSQKRLQSPMARQAAEDKIMDAAYEEAKSKTVRRGGINSDRRYARDVRSLVFLLVKDKIKDESKRKFAYKRLQLRNPIENAVSTSISEEDANFAFNGHTF